MKDIKELPITLQMALAIKTPELFNKEHYSRLMKVKNVVIEKMYKEYVKKAINWDKLKDPKVLKQLEKILKNV